MLIQEYHIYVGILACLSSKKRHNVPAIEKANNSAYATEIAKTLSAGLPGFWATIGLVCWSSQSPVG